MFRLQADSQKAVETFVQRVCKSSEVWILDDDGTVAGCPSNTGDFFVFPVFSDRAYAKRGSACWGDVFPPVCIPLSIYVEKVLPYQIENRDLAGPNWDRYMAGSEVDSAELLERLTKAIAAA